MPYKLIIYGCIILILVLSLGLVAHAVISGFLEYKSRPRKKLEYCHIHGFFDPKHALGLPGTTVAMCPVCFMDAVKKSS